MGQVHELAQAPLDNEIAAFPIFLARARYDFAVDGGSISTINLFPSSILPDNALILGAYLNVITVPVGATATVGIGSQAASDLQAAAAISGAPWSTTGYKVASLIALGSAPLKLTAARNVTITIGTAALTAGVIEVLVLYYAGDL